MIKDKGIKTNQKVRKSCEGILLGILKEYTVNLGFSKWTIPDVMCPKNPTQGIMAWTSF